MGTQRTSMKDVLAAIEGLTAAVQATLVAPVAQAPVAIATAPTPTGETSVNLDASYEAHMKAKVQDFANSKGEDCILYARKNGRGEVKLAYCLASKWTGLKDRGLIGAIAHIAKA